MLPHCLPSTSPGAESRSRTAGWQELGAQRRRLSLGTGTLGAGLAHLTASEPRAGRSRCQRSCQVGRRLDAGPLPGLWKERRPLRPAGPTRPHRPRGVGDQRGFAGRWLHSPVSNLILIESAERSLMMLNPGSLALQCGASGSSLLPHLLARLQGPAEGLPSCWVGLPRPE